MKTLYENECKYVLKHLDFPAHSLADIERDVTSGYCDIPCRIYLAEAPNEEYEQEAKKIDGENYSPDCFYIETLIGRDGLNEPWITSNWFLFYVDNDGEWHLCDDTTELTEAFEYVKEEYENWRK